MQNIRPEIWVLQRTWSKWKRCCICVYVFEGRRAATFCSLHVIMPVSLHMGMYYGKRRWAVVGVLVCVVPALCYDELHQPVLLIPEVHQLCQLTALSVTASLTGHEFVVSPPRKAARLCHRQVLSHRAVTFCSDLGPSGTWQTACYSRKPTRHSWDERRLVCWPEADQRGLWPSAECCKCACRPCKTLQDRCRCNTIRERRWRGADCRRQVLQTIKARFQRPHRHSDQLIPGGKARSAHRVKTCSKHVLPCARPEGILRSDSIAGM